MGHDRNGGKAVSESIENIEVTEVVSQMEQQEQENVTGSVQEELLPEETTVAFDFSERNDVADFLLSLGVDTYQVPTNPYECFTLGIRLVGFLSLVIISIAFVKWAVRFFSGRWLR